MYHVGYLISLIRLCFIAFLSLYVRTEISICLAANLQECLLNLLTDLTAYTTFSSQITVFAY